MYSLRSQNMICFDLLELKQIFERSQKRDLFLALAEKGYTTEELEANNKQKMHEIIDEIIAKSMKNKENIELFVAVDTCFTYFKGEDTKACFVLKRGMQADKIEVKNLEDLIAVVEENTLTDFAIWFGGLRQFQLKQYKDELETDTFYQFITKKLASYGNQLGDVNFLIILVGKLNKGGAMQENRIDFIEIHKRIETLNLKFNAEILVSYNEQNKNIVLNQIYPELKSLQKELGLPSSTWD